MIFNWLINKFLPWRSTATKDYVFHLEYELKIARQHIALLHEEKLADRTNPDLLRRERDNWRAQLAKRPH